MSIMRLNRAIASMGGPSRRKSEEYISGGRVQVNGSTVTQLHVKVDLDRDHVSLDGAPLRPKKSNLYYVLNKPKGYLCTHKEGGARTIYELLPKDERRLFSVGRLDLESSGLIIITSDGEYAHRAMHPSSNISRQYIVKCTKDIQLSHLERIREGTTHEGIRLQPYKTAKIRDSTLKITLKRGKKHEVRLIVAAAGLEIIELKRVTYGSFTLGNLAEGAYRSMNETVAFSLFE